MMRWRPLVLSLLARRGLQPLWCILYRLALAGRGFMNGDPAWNGEHAALARLAAGWARSGVVRPVVVDVGANAGAFTAAVLARAPEARVFAVEPHPNTVRRLAGRFAGTAGVVPVPCALADRAGMAMLYDTEADGSVHASLYAESFEVIHRRHPRATSVPVTTLDALAMRYGLGRIDLLKLDTEGAEGRILDGAQGLLAAGAIAAIQLEVNAHHLLSGLSLLGLSRRLPGFDLYRILPNGLAPLITAKAPYHPREEIYRYCNLLALPRTAG